MKKFFAALMYLSVFICCGGTALGGAPDSSGSDSCLQSHYPKFRTSQTEPGFMPGITEQEAICRMEYTAPDSRLAREEIKGDDSSPLVLEMRKLWIMGGVQNRNGDTPGSLSSVFSQNIVRKPPVKFLEISPGTKAEQVPGLSTEGKRERSPDLLRTLDTGKAGRIYLFRRADEKLPAICIEPGEGDSCREILTKEKYEQQKSKVSGETGGFMRFMGKVKDTVTGPTVKEIFEAKNIDFFGVRLTDVAYSFDYELAYIGFTARTANRRPFVTGESPQYIRDIFGALIRKFGEPAFKGKESGSGKPGSTSSYAIWLTENGFRIDAACEIPSDDSGICRNGRVSVRRLPPVKALRSTEGAEFFE
jgi:hypothetical protein